MGADHEISGSEDNILVAGRTAHGDSAAALGLIRAEWTSARNYAERVQNLTGAGSGARLNDLYFLDDRTVSDDDARDLLTGAHGADLFFANLGRGGKPRDKITDDRRDEFRGVSMEVGRGMG